MVAVAPRRVRTMMVRSDGTLVPREEAAAEPVATLASAADAAIAPEPTVVAPAAAAPRLPEPAPVEPTPAPVAAQPVPAAPSICTKCSKGAGSDALSAPRKPPDGRYQKDA